MARIIKILKSIRNHWKKSTFAACAITYGANYAKQSYEIESLMENYCKEAQTYGMQPLQPAQNPRKILVILNPTANRRKAVKQFEQYCAPILHLAGMCVEVVQTKSEGHARTILEEHKDNKTDAIVIAGGDGTLCESITGILRRGDNFLETHPIGVLPLGKENSFAATLFSRGTGNLDEIRRLADASMAIVKDQTTQTNVIKIETLPEEPSHKPVFALTGVEWGSYRDAHSKLDKYWYFGSFRKYATYIFNGYKSTINWNCTGNVTYSPPCTGCSNCYKQLQVWNNQVTTEQQQQSQSGGRWWGSFVPKQQAAASKYQEINQMENVLNETCSLKHHKQISTTDFTLFTGNNELILNLGPTDVSYLDFIRDGFNSENNEKRTINESIKARQIELHPNDEKQSFYSIDHEEFEVKPIRVTLIPKLIKIFVN